MGCDEHIMKEEERSMKETEGRRKGVREGERVGEVVHMIGREYRGGNVKEM